MSRQNRSLFEAYDEIRQHDGAAPVVQSVCYARAVKDVKPRQLVHVLATGGIKRDGYEIVPSGWNLSDYERNNLVLWRHSTAEPDDIMGNGEAWLSSADGMDRHLRGRTTFVKEGKSPRIDFTYDMYADGVLKAVSVRWEDDGDDSIEEIAPEEMAAAKVPGISPWALRFGGIRFKRARLQEYSLVPLGMDKEALTKRLRSAGASVLDGYVWKPELKTRDGKTIFSLEGYEPEKDRPLISIPSARQDDPPASEPEPEPEVTTPEPEPEPTPIDEPETGDDNGGDDGAEPDIGGEAAGDTPPTEASRTAISYGTHGKCPKADMGMAWDGAAARRALAKWASSDGSGAKDKIDWAKFRKGFLWYNSDSPENLGSYSYAHHSVVNGRFVAVWRGVVAAGQRMQQGNVGTPDFPAMRAHLGRHYEDFGKTPPWKTQKGRQYAELHAMLRSLQEGPAAEALRTAIVRIAEEEFGEERIRETWEPRPMPEGDRAMWETVRAVLSTAISEFIVDPDEREGKADSVVFALDESLGGIVREHMAAAAFREKVAAAIGIGLDEPDWEANVVRRIDELTGEMALEQPARGPSPSTDDGIEGLMSQLNRLKNIRGNGGGSILDRVAGRRS